MTDDVRDWLFWGIYAVTCSSGSALVVYFLYWEASYRWSEEFASNAVEDLTALLAEVRRLRQKCEELTELYNEFMGPAS